MPLTREQILEALRSVPDPARSGDLISLDRVAKVAICDGFVNIKVDHPAADRESRDNLRSHIVRAVKSLGDAVQNVNVEFASPVARPAESIASASPPPAASPKSAPAPQPRAATAPAPGSPPSPQKSARHSNPLPRVARIIAVGAGKGGVGKSTIAVNLAVGLARRGLAVGLLDADIYGPSIPTLLGLADLPLHGTERTFFPFDVHGIKAMTIGKMVEPDKPLIWRGPMAHGAFQQLLTQTEWGDLDYLVIDLPPGTGDVPLTMAQLIPLTGAVIVCTPQRVAQDDAVRAAAMFAQLDIPVLGVVENMSFFIGDDGKEYDIFGRGGAADMARRLGLALLGEIPIHMELRRNSDSGEPSANFQGNPALAAALTDMVDRTANAAAPFADKDSRPTLTIR